MLKPIRELKSQGKSTPQNLKDRRTQRTADWSRSLLRSIQVGTLNATNNCRKAQNGKKRKNTSL